MTDDIIQKQLDFLGPAYETVLKSARELRFDADSSAHVFAVALHGTIVELALACISMLNNGTLIGMPILMRSMNEALVDQTNLLTDADYAMNMEAANLKQMEKLLLHAGEDGNGLLKGLAKKWDVPKELLELRARLSELRERGRGELTVFERFRRAGREAEYRSVYVLLCLDAHGNTSALVDRHVETDGKRLELAFFKEPPVSSIRARIDAVTAMLLDSAEMMHDAFRLGCTTIKPLLEAHAKLRKSLFGHESPAGG